MRISCIILILLITTGYKPKAQTYTRNTNETAEAFVKRIYNVEELAHPVIETKEWDSMKKVIIAFHYANEYIIGTLLIPTENNKYKESLIDSFYHEEGGIRYREIETVFFANADHDKEREIVIQTTANPHSPRGADGYASGVYYATYIYDNPDIKNPQKQLPAFTKLNQKFDEEFEGKTYEINDDREKLIGTFKAKYKTVDAVRKALKQMGY